MYIIVWKDIYKKLKSLRLDLIYILLAAGTSCSSPKYYIDYSNGAREYFGCIKVLSKSVDDKMSEHRAKIVFHAFERTGDGSRLLVQSFVAVTLFRHNEQKRIKYLLSERSGWTIEEDTGIVSLFVTSDATQSSLHIDSLLLRPREVIEVEAIIPYYVIK